ncbi:Tudor domain-containing protein 3 [Eumeta japonica]|uniref:Tudor domain-containing protein 3 n=1 Tax=Eumeta variegata TaxID=151549 RepID=A0A4C1T0B9_EUMVA|nr:Tudor domain-containing protein 3 [Eumeta japonica]
MNFVEKLRGQGANEESTVAPRFLQLELSDGVNTVSALEFERIANLNLNVPPGTKLLIKSDKITLLNGFALLKAADVQVLGGSRTQAIAAASKAGQKKVFGGGQQNILDHNVKKIIEKGYSEEEAKQALKMNNNNLERTLYSLKRKNVRACTTENNAKTATVSANRIREKAVVTKKDETVSGKPQTNVSLFDFLTDKLPAVAQIPQPSSHVPHQNAASMAFITPNTNVYVAQTQQAVSQFGILSGENWHWKEGDLCLAKYWDDGNHLPLGSYETNIAAASNSRVPQQKTNLQPGMGCGVSQRYRSERQMYIPPPKRTHN